MGHGAARSRLPVESHPARRLADADQAGRHHRVGAERAARGIDPRLGAEPQLHAPFSHQEIILREALGLDGGTRINPSGGPLCANPMMTAGLIRIGEAAQRVGLGPDPDARRAVAHATSGPCLQQNLVCVLEGGA